MTKRRLRRTVVTPFATTDFAGEAVDDGLAYWKQVLPDGGVWYTHPDGHRERIEFDADYRNDVKLAYHDGAKSQVPFQLADPRTNGHGKDYDPERFRGAVVDMKDADELPPEITEGAGGLWAKIKFPTKKLARAVLNNPDLGVSMRIREGVERATDGKRFKRAAIHVLGTLDPVADGMSAWKPAVDFSGYSPDETIVDLSHSQYEETAVAKKTKRGTEFDFATLTADDISEFTAEDITAVTDEDVAGMTRVQFNAFMDAAVETGIVTEEELAELFTPANSEDDDDDDDDDDDEPVTRTTSLSTRQPARRRDVELSNVLLDEARSDASDALALLAEQRFTNERATLIGAGVPPAAIDLSRPCLERARDLDVDIDLSNGDTEEVHVTAIVRGLLDMLRGTVDIDLSNGHGGGSVDQDSRELAQLNAEFDRSFPRLAKNK